MKIWFPISASGTGSEIFTAQLASALAKQDVETVITRYPKHIEGMPWLLSRLKPPAQTDVVHLNAASAAGFFHHEIPSVITGHGAFELPDYDANKTLSQRLYHSMLIRPGIRESIAKATVVTAVSHWVADVFQKHYSARPVEVINNWVEPDLFSPAKKLPRRKLLFVGRSAWQKGSHLLPKLSTILGSEFELTCTLAANEWSADLPSNVRLIGSVTREKMPDLYRSHDALIVPSIAEGFCLAAVEAMSSGLPVFGFRGHGLDDVIGPMDIDCSAAMLDLNGLAIKIRDVFDSRHRYSEMSEQALHRSRSCFTEQVALERYVTQYRKITK